MKLLLVAKKHPLASSLATFLLGAVLILGIQRVFADTTIIYACVKQNTGSIRIVDANTTCGANETALSWNQQGPQGIQGPPGPTGVPGPTGIPGSGGGPSGLPYICTNCTLYPYASAFQGKDFTNAQLPNVNFGGADLHGIIFKGGFFQESDFSKANLTDADFSNLYIRIFFNPNFRPDGGVLFVGFVQANLTNANFSNNIFADGDDFTQANLQGTNFSGTSFTRSNFTGATNGTTANFTNTTWSNTTCPDGTNSNNDGNTCLGHF